LPAMVYDPEKQKIDARVRAIGNKVCEVFCSYQEIKKIESLLERAESA
jgi:hypothetical protein